MRLNNINNNQNFQNLEDKSVKDLIEHKEIKKATEINFNLIKRKSYNGLDNVEACYTNVTFQFFANKNQITEYLLNQNNYDFLYQNYDICKLTLQYIQVFIGLFCSVSTFFRGVQANNSKDFIIFLLEIMNNELTKIHNIKHNINNDENESYQKIDISDGFE